MNAVNLLTLKIKYIPSIAIFFSYRPGQRLTFRNETKPDVALAVLSDHEHPGTSQSSSFPSPTSRPLPEMRVPYLNVSISELSPEKLKSYSKVLWKCCSCSIKGVNVEA